MPRVTIPIIDTLFHPPIGVLSRLAWPANPYGGPFITGVPPNVPTVDATYGVVLRLDSVSPDHGRDVSFPVEFDPPLGKFCVTYSDLSGLLVLREPTPWTYDQQYFLWDEAAPNLFNLYLYPGVTVNLFWLVT